VKDGCAALNDLCASLKSVALLQEPNLDFLQAPIREEITQICKVALSTPVWSRLRHASKLPLFGSPVVPSS
jgi:hypothetical protein